MTTERILTGQQLRLRVSGRLDAKTAPGLRDELTSVLSDDIHSLIFDLGGLEYLSSAGLRVILFAYKQMLSRGEFLIYNADGFVSDVLNMSGFASVIPLCRDEGQAVSAADEPEPETEPETDAETDAQPLDLDVDDEYPEVTIALDPKDDEYPEVTVALDPVKPKPRRKKAAHRPADESDAPLTLDVPDIKTLFKSRLSEAVAAIDLSLDGESLLGDESDAAACDASANIPPDEALTETLPDDVLTETPPDDDGKEPPSDIYDEPDGIAAEDESDIITVSRYSDDDDDDDDDEGMAYKYTYGDDDDTAAVYDWDKEDDLIK